MKTASAGFTLLEILLTVAIMGSIAGIGIGVYYSFIARNDLDIATTSVAHGYRRAQLLSQASDGDTTWGVNISSSNITVFKGASYESRDVSYDEDFDLPGSIVPSGVLSVVFAKFTGLPQSTGTTTFTSNTNDVRTVYVSPKGAVSY